MNRTPETIDNRFWAHFATHIRKITMASRISNIFYAILGLSTAVVDFLDVPYGNLRLLRTKAAEVLHYLVLIDIAKGGNCTVDYNPVPLHHRPSTKHLLYNMSAKTVTKDKTLGIIFGTSVNYSLSRRFGLSFNYKLSTSTNPSVPMLSFFLIGSRMNL